MENARWLEAIHTKGWLDLQIRLHKEYEKSYELNDFVRAFIPCDYIILGKGADYITNLLGMELKEECTGYDDFPFKYSFEYNGVEFVQLSEKQLSVVQNRNVVKAS